MALSRQRDVIGVLPAASQVAIVLFALEGLTYVRQLGEIGSTHVLTP
jgi:hypothetical protein